MTISRTLGGGKGVGDKLTAGEINAVDANIENALDKRSGQTDTLGSVVACSGAGRIVDTLVTGANADTTYQPGGGNKVIRVTDAVTANRAYTLGTTGVQTGDVAFIYAETTFLHEIIVKDQASATMFVLGHTAAADGPWASFIYIGGWRLFQSGPGRLRSVEFLDDGTTSVPYGVTLAFAVGFGGGGGGGAAIQVSSVVTNVLQGGGGGGGGALMSVQMLTGLVGGQTLTVNVGAGGQGGSGSGDHGDDGEATTVTNGVMTWTFPGAAGGFGGLATTVSGAESSWSVLWSLGGQPTAPTSAPNTFFSGVYDTPPGYPHGASVGGLGRVRLANSGGAGGTSPQGYLGGTYGTGGADDSTHRGGGGGGGGGGGPGGAGGAGGNGGAGASAGVGGVGSNGAAGGANSGAGGGGGGAPGMGSAGAGVPGNGGDGGDGKLTIYWVK